MPQFGRGPSWEESIYCQKPPKHLILLNSILHIWLQFIFNLWFGAALLLVSNDGVPAAIFYGNNLWLWKYPAAIKEDEVEESINDDYSCCASPHFSCRVSSLFSAVLMMSAPRCVRCLECASKQRNQHLKYAPLISENSLTFCGNISFCTKGT